MSTNKEKFLDLCKRAKRLSEEDDDESIRKSLEIYVEALTFNPSNEKLIKKIKKLKAYLIQAKEGEDEDEHSIYQNKNNDISIIKNNKYKRRNDDDDESEENDDDDKEQNASMTHMGDGFYLASTVYRRLYNYQRDGVKYLYGLFQQQKGGILGDDMGLGKTVQVCSFLSGMFDSKRIKYVIIVLPPPLILNWMAELKKWTPNLKVEKYHDASIKERARILLSIQQSHGILLTTYNLVGTSFDKLSDYKGRSFIWDHCILDEGHKIKNPSAKTTKAVHSINAKTRIILSGTPIMNNLKELWSLFDWTHKGQLLGRMKTFRESYEQPILRSREKDATQSEQKYGEMMARSLQSLIGPFLFRRSKKQVVAAQRLEVINGLVGDSPRMPDLGVKSDLICWLRLSDPQLMVYNEFLTSDEVKDLLTTTRSPLVGLTILKKICDHPRLLSNQKCRLLGVTQDQDNLMEDEDDNTDFDVSIIPEHVLINECGKMAFLIKLLGKLKEQGHRTLVFSQSRRILDIVQKIMLTRGNNMLRIDGRIKSFQERQTIIDNFQNDTSIDVLLLTSKVGGVGLNLTAANRVVIYDPSWNPSVDSQAIDRAFRIGQERDVVVYRLVTCGTVEEKIYRRQIYKDSVTKKVLKESKNPMRHFTREEIRSLFKLGNINESETSKQINLQFEGDKQEARDASQDVQSNIAFLTKIEHCNGVSEHDLVFCRDEDDDEEGDEISKQYLDKRMTDAFQLLNIESEENRKIVETTGKYAGGGKLKTKVPSSSRQASGLPSSSSQPKNSLPAHSNQLFSQTSAFLKQEEEDKENYVFTKSPLRPLPVHTSTPRAIVIDDEDDDDDGGGDIRKEGDINKNRRMESDDDNDDTKKCAVGSDDDYEDDEVFTSKYINNAYLAKDVKDKDTSIEESTYKSPTNPLTNLEGDTSGTVCINNEKSVNKTIQADPVSSIKSCGEFNEDNSATAIHNENHSIHPLYDDKDESKNDDKDESKNDDKDESKNDDKDESKNKDKDESKNYTFNDAKDDDKIVENNDDDAKIIKDARDVDVVPDNDDIIHSTSSSNKDINKGGDDAESSVKHVGKVNEDNSPMELVTKLSFNLGDVSRGSDLFADSSDDVNDDKSGVGDDDVGICKDFDTKDAEENVTKGDETQSLKESVITPIKNAEKDDGDENEEDEEDDKEEKGIENAVNAKSIISKTHLFDKFLHLSSQNVSKIDDVAKDGSVQVESDNEDSEDDFKKNDDDLVVYETDDEETEEKMNRSGNDEVVAETDDDENDDTVDDSIDSNVVSKRNDNLGERKRSLNESSNHRRSVKDINSSNDSCDDEFSKKISYSKNSNKNQGGIKDSSTHGSVGSDSLGRKLINQGRKNASVSKSVDNKSSMDASMKSDVNSSSSDNDDSIVKTLRKGKVILSSDEEENETGDYNESDDEDEDENKENLKKELNSDVDDYEDSFIDDDEDDD